MDKTQETSISRSYFGKKSKIAIALFTAVTFFVTNVVWMPGGFAQGTPLAAEVALPYQATLDTSLGFSIPRELGSIEYFKSGKGPAVIQLQTAHGHSQAQQQIRGILHHLEKNYGIKTLLVEGSAGELGADRLNFFPEDPKLTMKIVDAFTKHALVTGEELYLLDQIGATGHDQRATEKPVRGSWTDARGPRALGVENLKSYLANGESFAATLRQKEKTDQFLRNMNEGIERLQSVYLNDALRGFLKRLESYEKNLTPVDAWFSFMKAEALKRLRLDLSGPGAQIDWPMMVRIFKIQELSAKLDRKAFPKERDDFLKALKRFLQDGASSSSSSVIRHPSTYAQIEQLLRSEQLSQQLPDPETSLLFEDMVRQLPRNFNYEAFPNVRYFIGLLLLQSELKAPQLMQEAGKLSERLLTKLAKTETEKTLVGLLKDYRLLQKLFALELTPQDYEVIAGHEKTLRPSVIAERFESVARGPKAVARTKAVHFSHLSDLDQLFDLAMKFYEGAKQRDLEMIQGVERRLKETGARKAVIITGGFHSGPFRDYFSSKDYSYALITPRITSSDDAGKLDYVHTVMAAFKKQDEGGRKEDGVNSFSPSVIRHPPSSSKETYLFRAFQPSGAAPVSANIITRAVSIARPFVRNAGQLETVRAALTGAKSAAARAEARAKEEEIAGILQEVGINFDFLVQAAFYEKLFPQIGEERARHIAYTYSTRNFVLSAPLTVRGAKIERITLEIENHDSIGPTFTQVRFYGSDTSKGALVDFRLNNGNRLGYGSSQYPVDLTKDLLSAFKAEVLRSITAMRYQAVTKAMKDGKFEHGILTGMPEAIRQVDNVTWRYATGLQAIQTSLNHRTPEEFILSVKDGGPIQSETALARAKADPSAVVLYAISFTKPDLRVWVLADVKPAAPEKGFFFPRAEKRKEAPVLVKLWDQYMWDRSLGKIFIGSMTAVTFFGVWGFSGIFTLAVMAGILALVATSVITVFVKTMRWIFYLALRIVDPVQWNIRRLGYWEYSSEAAARLIEIGSSVGPRLMKIWKPSKMGLKAEMIREKILRILVKTEGAKALPLLEGALADDSLQARRAAVEGIKELNDLHGLSLALVNDEERVREIAVPALFQKKQWDILAGQKKSPYEDLRAAAFWALRERDGSRAIPELTAALNDDAGRVRIAVTHLLQDLLPEFKRSPESVIPRLRNNLKYPDYRVCEATADLLKDLGAWAELAEGLDSSFEYVRMAAVPALVEFRGAESVPELVARLKNQKNSPAFRKMIAAELRKIGDPRSSEALQSFDNQLAAEAARAAEEASNASDADDNSRQTGYDGSPYGAWRAELRDEQAIMADMTRRMGLAELYPDEILSALWSVYDKEGPTGAFYLKLKTMLTGHRNYGQFFDALHMRAYSYWLEKTQEKKFEEMRADFSRKFSDAYYGHGIFPGFTIFDVRSKAGAQKLIIRVTSAKVETGEMEWKSADVAAFREQGPEVRPLLVRVPTPAFVTKFIEQFRQMCKPYGENAALSFADVGSDISVIDVTPVNKPTIYGAFRIDTSKPGKLVVSSEKKRVTVYEDGRVTEDPSSDKKANKLTAEEKSAKLFAAFRAEKRESITVPGSVEKAADRSVGQVVADKLSGVWELIAAIAHIGFLAALAAVLVPIWKAMKFFFPEVNAQSLAGIAKPFRLSGLYLVALIAPNAGGAVAILTGAAYLGWITFAVGAALGGALIFTPRLLPYLLPAENVSATARVSAPERDMRSEESRKEKRSSLDVSAGTAVKSMIEQMLENELMVVRGLYYESVRAKVPGVIKPGDDRFKVAKQAYEELLAERKYFFLPAPEELGKAIDQGGGIQLIDAAIRGHQEKAQTVRAELRGGAFFDAVRLDQLMGPDVELAGPVGIEVAQLLQAAGVRYVEDFGRKTASRSLQDGSQLTGPEAEREEWRRFQAQSPEERAAAWGESERAERREGKSRKPNAKAGQIMEADVVTMGQVLDILEKKGEFTGFVAVMLEASQGALVAMAAQRVQDFVVSLQMSLLVDPSQPPTRPFPSIAVISDGHKQTIRELSPNAFWGLFGEDLIAEGPFVVSAIAAELLRGESPKAALANILGSRAELREIVATRVVNPPSENKRLTFEQGVKLLERLAGSKEVSLAMLTGYPSAPLTFVSARVRKNRLEMFTTSGPGGFRPYQTSSRTIFVVEPKDGTLLLVPQASDRGLALPRASARDFRAEVRSEEKFRNLVQKGEYQKAVEALEASTASVPEIMQERGLTYDYFDQLTDSLRPDTVHDVKSMGWGSKSYSVSFRDPVKLADDKLAVRAVIEKVSRAGEETIQVVLYGARPGDEVARFDIEKSGIAQETIDLKTNPFELRRTMALLRLAFDTTHPEYRSKRFEKLLSFYSNIGKVENDRNRDFEGAMEYFKTEILAKAAAENPNAALALFRQLYLPYVLQFIPPRIYEKLAADLRGSDHPTLNQMGNDIASENELLFLENDLKSRSQATREAAVDKIVALAKAGKIRRAPLSLESNNHVHGKDSYSPFYPEEIVYRAWRAGLQTVGLIDHYTLAGAERFLAAAKKFGIKATVGFEIQVNSKGTPLEGKEINYPGAKTIYVLVHSIAQLRDPALQKMLRDSRREKAERYVKMINGDGNTTEGIIAKLHNQLGIELKGIGPENQDKVFDYKRDVDPFAEREEGDDFGNVLDRHLGKALAIAMKADETTENMRKIFEALPEGEQTALKKNYENYLKTQKAYQKALAAGDTTPMVMDDALEFMRGVFMKPGAKFSCLILPNDIECPSIKTISDYGTAARGLFAIAYLGSAKGTSVTEEQRLLLDRKLISAYRAAGALVIVFAIMPQRNDNDDRKNASASARDEKARIGSGVDINRADQPIREPRGGVTSPPWFKKGDSNYDPQVGIDFEKGAGLFVANEIFGRAGYGLQSELLKKLLPGKTEEEGANLRFDFLAWAGMMSFEELQEVEWVLGQSWHRDMFVSALVSAWRAELRETGATEQDALTASQYQSLADIFNGVLARKGSAETFTADEVRNVARVFRASNLTEAPKVAEKFYAVLTLEEALAVNRVIGTSIARRGNTIAGAIDAAALSVSLQHKPVRLPALKETPASGKSGFSGVFARVVAAVTPALNAIRLKEIVPRLKLGMDLTLQEYAIYLRSGDVAIQSLPTLAHHYTVYRMPYHDIYFEAIVGLEGLRISRSHGKEQIFLKDRQPALYADVLALLEQKASRAEKRLSNLTPRSNAARGIAFTALFMSAFLSFAEDLVVRTTSYDPGRVSGTGTIGFVVSGTNAASFKAVAFVLGSNALTGERTPVTSDEMTIVPGQTNTISFTDSAMLTEPLRFHRVALTPVDPFDFTAGWTSLEAVSVIVTNGTVLIQRNDAKKAGSALWALTPNKPASEAASLRLTTLAPELSQEGQAANIQVLVYGLKGSRERVLGTYMYPVTATTRGFDIPLDAIDPALPLTRVEIMLAKNCNLKTLTITAADFVARSAAAGPLDATVRRSELRKDAGAGASETTAKIAERWKKIRYMETDPEGVKLKTEAGEKGEGFLRNAQAQIRKVAEQIRLDPRILEKLLQFTKVIRVRIPLTLDEGGETQYIDGYRIGHAPYRGPYKGGIRFALGVNESMIKALATEMSVKNAIAGLPYGGGKGGVAINPKELSVKELARLMRGYVAECLKQDPNAFGPLSDVPAGDVGTTSREMGWFADEFLKIKNPELFDNDAFRAALAEEDETALPYLEYYMKHYYGQRHIDRSEGSPVATVTAKPEGKGGAAGRTPATGLGLYYVTREALKIYGERLGIGAGVAGQRIAVEAYGNVGSYAARSFYDNGAHVMAIKEFVDGQSVAVAAVKDTGLDLNALDKHLAERNADGTSKKNTILTYAKAHPEDARVESIEDFWASDVTVLALAAKEKTVNKDIAKLIRAKIISEGANGPLENDGSEQILLDKGAIILPDVATNDGGVAFSSLEWRQNNIGELWPEVAGNGLMEDKVVSAFYDISRVSESQKITLREAAYQIAISRIVDAMLAADPDLAAPFDEAHPSYVMDTGAKRWRPETLAELNEVDSTEKRLELIRRADRAMQQKLDALVEEAIDELPEERGSVILIGGPRASGKPELGNLILAKLRERGINANILDLDYQTVEDVSRALQGHKITTRLENGTNGEVLQLAPNEILVVHGYDALGDRILGLVKAMGGQAFPVMAYSSPDILLAGNWALTAYDLRLMRDMLSSLALGEEETVQEVLRRWKWQRVSETEAVFATWKNAKHAINTYMPYELPFLKPLLTPLIDAAIRQEESPDRDVGFTQSILRHKDEGFTLSVLRHIEGLLKGVKGWDVSLLKGNYDSLLWEYVQHYAPRRVAPFEVTLNAQRPQHSEGIGNGFSAFLVETFPGTPAKAQIRILGEQQDKKENNNLTLEEGETKIISVGKRGVGAGQYEDVSVEINVVRVDPVKQPVSGKYEGTVTLKVKPLYDIPWATFLDRRAERRAEVAASAAGAGALDAELAQMEDKRAALEARIAAKMKLLGDNLPSSVQAFNLMDLRRDLRNVEKRIASRKSLLAAGKTTRVTGEVVVPAADVNADFGARIAKRHGTRKMSDRRPVAFDGTVLVGTDGTVSDILDADLGARSDIAGTFDDSSRAERRSVAGVAKPLPVSLPWALDGVLSPSQDYQSQKIGEISTGGTLEQELAQVGFSGDDDEKAKKRKIFETAFSRLVSQNGLVKEAYSAAGAVRAIEFARNIPMVSEFSNGGRTLWVMGDYDPAGKRVRLSESVFGTEGLDEKTTEAAVLFVEALLYQESIQAFLASREVAAGATTEEMFLTEQVFLLMNVLDYLIVQDVENPGVQAVSPFQNVLDRFLPAMEKRDGFSPAIRNLLGEYRKNYLDPEGAMHVVKSYVAKLFGKAQIPEINGKEFLDLFEKLGDHYRELGDYRNATHAYFKGIEFSTTDPERKRNLRGKLTDAVNLFHQNIPADKKATFKGILESPGANLDEFWKALNDVTLIRELVYIPEALVITSSRYDQLRTTYDILSLLEAHRRTSEGGLKAFFDQRRGQEAPLDADAVDKLDKAYHIVESNDYTDKKTQPLKKILWLTAFLQHYARIFLNDEATDSWLIIPQLLQTLDIFKEDEERDLIYSLVTLQRNFSTLHFGEGSPTWLRRSIDSMRERWQEVQAHLQDKNAVAGPAKAKSGAKHPRWGDWVEVPLVNKDHADLKGVRLPPLLDEALAPTKPQGLSIRARLEELLKTKTMFEWFPRVESGTDSRKDRDIFKKYPNKTVSQHTLELIEFLDLIEKGDLDTFNKLKKGIKFNQAQFDLYRKAFQEIIRYGTDGDAAKVAKRRNLFYLTVFFHDIGIGLGAGNHEDIGAGLIAEAAILQTMGYSSEEVEEVLWLIRFHVDLGTIEFGERSTQNLFYGNYPAPFGKERQYLRTLALLNSLDVLATREGEAMSREKLEFFLRVFQEDDFLNRFNQGFFWHRIRKFASNGQSHISKATFDEAKQAIDALQREYPAEYQKFYDFFNNPEEASTLDYSIFFLQSLNAETLVRLLFFVSLAVLKARETAGKPDIHRINFTAPSGVAPFSKEPIEEIFGSDAFSFGAIITLTQRPFEEIRMALKDFGLDIAIKTVDGVPVFEFGNRKLSERNRYFKIAALQAATYVLSRFASVATDAHIRNFAFLQDLSKFSSLAHIEGSWPAVRLFEGFLGEGKQAFEIARAWEPYEKKGLLEVAEKKVQQAQEKVQALTADHNRLQEEIAADVQAIHSVTAQVNSLRENGGRAGIPEKQREKQRLEKDLGDKQDRLLEQKRAAEVANQREIELSEVFKELQNISAQGDFESFVDFMRTVNFKNAIFNFRKIKSRDPRSLIRLLYMLSKLSEKSAVAKVFDLTGQKTFGPGEVETVNFSTAADRVAGDSNYEALYNAILQGLAAHDMAAIKRIAGQSEPARKFSRILGLGENGIFYDVTEARRMLVVNLEPKYGETHVGPRAERRASNAITLALMLGVAAFFTAEVVSARGFGISAQATEAPATNKVSRQERRSSEWTEGLPVLADASSSITNAGQWLFPAAAVAGVAIFVFAVYSHARHILEEKRKEADRSGKSSLQGPGKKTRSAGGETSHRAEIRSGDMTRREFSLKGIWAAAFLGGAAKAKAGIFSSLEDEIRKGTRLGYFERTAWTRSDKKPEPAEALADLKRISNLNLGAFPAAAKNVLAQSHYADSCDILVKALASSGDSETNELVRAVESQYIEKNQLENLDVAARAIVVTELRNVSRNTTDKAKRAWAQGLLRELRDAYGVSLDEAGFEMISATGSTQQMKFFINRYVEEALKGRVTNDGDLNGFAPWYTKRIEGIKDPSDENTEGNREDDKGFNFLTYQLEQIMDGKGGWIIRAERRGSTSVTLPIDEGKESVDLQAGKGAKKEEKSFHPQAQTVSVAGHLPVLSGPAGILQIALASNSSQHRKELRSTAEAVSRAQAIADINGIRRDIGLLIIHREVEHPFSGHVEILVEHLMALEKDTILAAEQLRSAALNLLRVARKDVETNRFEDPEAGTPVYKEQAAFYTAVLDQAINRIQGLHVQNGSVLNPGWAALAVAIGSEGASTLITGVKTTGDRLAFHELLSLGASQALAPALFQKAVRAPRGDVRLRAEKRDEGAVIRYQSPTGAVIALSGTTVVVSGPVQRDSGNRIVFASLPGTNGSTVVLFDYGAFDRGESPWVMTVGGKEQPLSAAAEKFIVSTARKERRVGDDLWIADVAGDSAAAAQEVDVAFERQLAMLRAREFVANVAEDPDLAAAEADAAMTRQLERSRRQMAANVTGDIEMAIAGVEARGRQRRIPEASVLRAERRSDGARYRISHKIPLAIIEGTPPQVIGNPNEAWQDDRGVDGYGIDGTVDYKGRILFGIFKFQGRRYVVLFDPAQDPSIKDRWFVKGVTDDDRLEIVETSQDLEAAAENFKRTKLVGQKPQSAVPTVVVGAPAAISPMTPAASASHAMSPVAAVVSKEPVLIGNKLVTRGKNSFGVIVYFDPKNPTEPLFTFKTQPEPTPEEMPGVISEVQKWFSGHLEVKRLQAAAKLKKETGQVQNGSFLPDDSMASPKVPSQPVVLATVIRKIDGRDVNIEVVYTAPGGYSVRAVQNKADKDKYGEIRPATLAEVIRDPKALAEELAVKDPAIKAEIRQADGAYKLAVEKAQDRERAAAAAKKLENAPALSAPKTNKKGGDQNSHAIYSQDHPMEYVLKMIAAHYPRGTQEYADASRVWGMLAAEFPHLVGKKVGEQNTNDKKTGNLRDILDKVQQLSKEQQFFKVLTWVTGGMIVTAVASFAFLSLMAALSVVLITMTLGFGLIHSVDSRRAKLLKAGEVQALKPLEEVLSEEVAWREMQPLTGEAVTKGSRGFSIPADETKFIASLDGVSITPSLLSRIRATDPALHKQLLMALRHWILENEEASAGKRAPNLPANVKLFEKADAHFQIFLGKRSERRSKVSQTEGIQAEVPQTVAIPVAATRAVIKEVATSSSPASIRLPSPGFSGTVGSVPAKGPSRNEVRTSILPATTIRELMTVERLELIRYYYFNIIPSRLIEELDELGGKEAIVRTLQELVGIPVGYAADDTAYSSVLHSLIPGEEPLYISRPVSVGALTVTDSSVQTVKNPRGTLAIGQDLMTEYLSQNPTALYYLLKMFMTEDGQTSLVTVGSPALISEIRKKIQSKDVVPASELGSLGKVLEALEKQSILRVEPMRAGETTEAAVLNRLGASTRGGITTLHLTAAQMAGLADGAHFAFGEKIGAEDLAVASALAMPLKSLADLIASIPDAQMRGDLLKNFVAENLPEVRANGTNGFIISQIAKLAQQFVEMKLVARAA